MKSTVAGLSAATLAIVAASSAFAGPTPSPAPKKPVVKATVAKTMTCPSCKMPMALTKSAGAPVAVPIKGTTYYCCTACASGKAMAAKAAKPTKTATPAPKK